MALDALDESRADRGFLVHFFRFRGFRDVTTGTSQPQIVRQNLVRLKIPLPSLTEQRRIAEVLDAVDALRERRRTGIGQLNTLTQAVFTDLFADHSTTAKDWATAPLASLATTTSGGTPKRTVADYYGGNVPWVKSGELYQGVVTQTEEYLTARGLAESSAKLMPTGTVLIAMYGATAGVIATLGMPAATNQAVCCVTPGERLNRVFLVHLLKTQTPSLLAKRVGGAQPNLSQDMIRNLLVPLPPLALQGEFARIADAIEDLTALHRSSLVELDELFSSLQHRAFRGEL
jgi:type I restriction enzyme S subunit